MKTLTPIQHTAYRLFAQTVLLLLVFAALNLLSAVKFLAASDPLVTVLPYHQAGPWSSLMLHLAALTGLLGGGIYALAAERAVFPGDKRLTQTAWLWTALLILAFAAGALGLLEGRAGLELPPILDALLIVTLALLVAQVILAAPRLPVIQVWAVGLAICALGSGIGLVATPDYLADRALRALALNLNLNIGWPLAAVALGFWLMHRFSNITPGWAERGLYVVAGLLALAGALISLPPLTGSALGSLGLIAAPVAYWIFAAHSYRALADRNPTHTLAAHWFSLSLLLALLGPGLLGALQAAPVVHIWTSGTRLTDLQTTLTALAVAAMALGVINQGAAELRGHNWRITGLMPFWLVAFGVGGASLALAGAGVAQVYLERVLSIGYLDAQTLLIPLYAAWVLGWLAAALGAGIYGLTFWLRRPVETR